ncbi:hypothetical protein N9B71_03615 [Pirellulales bacterium]|nr:hypothetical protein [Pirellulales bacterium]
MKSILNIRLRWMTGLLFFVAGTAPLTMTRAAEETPTVLAVAACDSFAEIREQCAWLGGLIGFPVLGGLPDTYAMLITGGKGLKGLDVERPVGVVVTVDGETPSIHGFLPTTDSDVLMETLSGVPFRSMVDMTGAGEWVVVTLKGQPVSIEDPQTLLTSITDKFSFGMKFFLSRWPDSLVNSMVEQIDTRRSAIEALPIPLEGVPMLDMSKNVSAEALSQIEGILFGLSVEKKTERVFFETHAVFEKDSDGARLCAGAGDLEPRVSFPTASSPYAVKLHVAKNVMNPAEVEILKSQLGEVLPQNEMGNKVIDVLIQQLFADGAIEFLVGLTSPKASDAAIKIPGVVLGAAIANGDAFTQDLKNIVGDVNGIPPNVELTLDVAKDAGYEFHDITIDQSGQKVKVTVAISDKQLYAMLRSKDDLEYKAPADGVVEDFRPMAAVRMSYRECYEVAAGLQSDLAKLAEEKNAKGTVEVLLRSIPRGVAMRFTLDSDAITSGVTVGKAIVSNLNF